MRITPDKHEVTTSIFGLTRGWFWLGMFMLTIFFVGTGVMMTKPYWLGLERQAYVASHQYVEARRTSLITLLTQVQGIDTTVKGQELTPAMHNALRRQKSGLVDRMRTAAAEIPADAVPAAVTRYLATN